MVSAEQKHIDQVVRSRPPAPNSNLEGWVLLADWSSGEGEDILTVMGGPDAHIVELKGFLHQGLYDIARGMYRVASGYIEDHRLTEQQP